MSDQNQPGERRGRRHGEQRSFRDVPSFSLVSQGESGPIYRKLGVVQVLDGAKVNAVRFVPDSKKLEGVLIQPGEPVKIIKFPGK